MPLGSQSRRSRRKECVKVKKSECVDVNACSWRTGNCDERAEVADNACARRGRVEGPSCVLLPYVLSVREKARPQSTCVTGAVRDC